MCEIPAKLELPIFMLRYPAERIWGSVEMAIGTVLVTRDNRRDLHSHHIEALCHYCRDILHPLFVDSMGFGRSLSGIKTKGTLLQTVAKEEFESYFRDYCAEKSKTDGSGQERYHLVITFKVLKPSSSCTKGTTTRRQVLSTRRVANEFEVGYFGQLGY